MVRLYTAYLDRTYPFRGIYHGEYGQAGGEDRVGSGHAGPGRYL